MLLATVFKLTRYRLPVRAGRIDGTKLECCGTFMRHIASNTCALDLAFNIVVVRYLRVFTKNAEKRLPRNVRYDSGVYFLQRIVVNKLPECK